MARISLNGNMRIAPMNLKTISIVNPIIRNGSRINQRMGKININANANGQHNTRRINHRRIAINDFTILSYLVGIVLQL